MCDRIGNSCLSFTSLLFWSPLPLVYTRIIFMGLSFRPDLTQFPATSLFRTCRNLDLNGSVHLIKASRRQPQLRFSQPSGPFLGTLGRPVSEYQIERRLSVDVAWKACKEITTERKRDATYPLLELLQSVLVLPDQTDRHSLLKSGVCSKRE